MQGSMGKVAGAEGEGGEMISFPSDRSANAVTSTVGTKQPDSRGTPNPPLRKEAPGNLKC